MFSVTYHSTHRGLPSKAAGVLCDDIYPVPLLVAPTELDHQHHLPALTCWMGGPAGEIGQAPQDLRGWRMWHLQLQYRCGTSGLPFGGLDWCWSIAQLLVYMAAAETCGATFLIACSAGDRYGDGL